MRRLVAGLAALAGLAAPAGAAVDPFHLAVERDARAAASRGAAVDAARLYRIACFGMLDEPERLGACTVRLALAQHETGDREGFRESWNRLATVEERFQGLSRAAVEEGEKQELARAARAWLTAEQLRAIPALGSAEPAAAAPSAEDHARLAAARELLAGQPAREELAAALTAVRPIADAWPADPAPARLAGDLAYRAALWPVCAEYYRRAGAPGFDAPLARFYMAVCLYETGARGEAAELLAPVAARLRPTPFVAAYLERILGASSLP